MLRSRRKRIRRMNEAIDRVGRGEDINPSHRMSDVDLFKKMKINTRPN